MNRHEFVRVLIEAAPNATSLRRAGLGEQETRELLSTLTARRRIQAAVPVLQSELGWLLCEYDCGNLQVGQVKFLAELVRIEFGFQFAWCEADPLVVDKNDLVWMLDHEDMETRIPCAQSSFQFLDSLAEFSRIRRDRSLWQGKVNEAAFKCAAAAGGTHFRAFYVQLFAFLDA